MLLQAGHPRDGRRRSTGQPRHGRTTPPRLTRPKLPNFVTTLWFEPSGAARYTACRIQTHGKDRVRLVHLERGNVQADLSMNLYVRLMAKGRIRPLAEVPTQPSNQRIRVKTTPST